VFPENRLLSGNALLISVMTFLSIMPMHLS